MPPLGSLTCRTGKRSGWFSRATSTIGSAFDHTGARFSGFGLRRKRTSLDGPLVAKGVVTPSPVISVTRSVTQYEPNG